MLWKVVVVTCGALVGGAPLGTDATGSSVPVQSSPILRQSFEQGPPRPTDLQFTHLGQQDGLVHDSVSAIAHDPQADGSLAGDFVRDMLQDKDGQLWHAVNSVPGGLSRLDPVTGATVSYSTETIVEPPWWRSTWVYAVLASLILAAVALVVRWRTGRIKQRNLYLEQENQRFERVIDAVPAGLAILDPEGRVLFCNPVARSSDFAAVGLTVGAMVRGIGDRSLAEILEPPELGSWHECRLQDGAVGRCFAAIARPIDPFGGTDEQRWLLSVIDTTIERQVQARAATQQRLASVGTFAAGMAHDFNNILTVMSLSADLARSVSAIEPTVRTQIDRIAHQALDASHLIQQLLAFSRQHELEKRILDVGETVREHSSFLDRMLTDEYQLAVTIQARPHIIDADPTQVRQAITNLVTNARDAMPDGGLIEVEVTSSADPVEIDGIQHEPGAVTICVRDRGHGIADEVRSQLFEPFVTTKDIGKGTGLGLSQVVGIMSQHGGAVDVHSNPGDGATFSLQFPVADADGLPPATTEPTVSRPPTGEQVLLVDDDPELREVLAEGLSRLGYKVTSTDNGKQALQQWLSEPTSYDLILSDLSMPVLDGLKLYKATSAAGRTAPFVFLTGKMCDDHDAQAVAALAREELVTLLHKPISIEDLDATLREALLPA